MPDEVADVLSRPIVASVTTVNPDGSPQVTVVWIEQQQDDVVFWTDVASIKVRNLTNDARLAISLIDDQRSLGQGVPVYYTLYGRATIVPGEDAELIRRLTTKYMGRSDYPFGSTEATAVVRVRAERFAGNGLPRAE